MFIYEDPTKLGLEKNIICLKNDWFGVTTDPQLKYISTSSLSCVQLKFFLAVKTFLHGKVFVWLAGIEHFCS